MYADTSINPGSVAMLNINKAMSSKKSTKVNVLQFPYLLNTGRVKKNATRVNNDPNAITKPTPFGPTNCSIKLELIYVPGVTWSVKTKASMYIIVRW